MGTIVDVATTHTSALDLIRSRTKDTKYEGHLWLVGGWVRDKVLGVPAKQDIDIVLEGDALDLAHFLYSEQISLHAPVTYPRFGTAMVCISGQNVELVTARRESYDQDSRKPARVEPATIAEDAARRDFTINTLIENVHTGEIVDPLGCALRDIKGRVIRTPLPPQATFDDDPLRMLRAVRFATRLGFEIEHETWTAIERNALRLAPPTVSAERIRDEFVKIVVTDYPSRGLDLLRHSGLLAQFAPELLPMWGCIQNEFHSLPVWEHVMLALDNLVRFVPDASQNLRLAVLLHDVGKPATRSVGEDGRVHFYAHEDVGARMANTLLTRLKFPGSDVDEVANLVAQHMRIGEYKPTEWTDAAVRRFVRAAEGHIDELFEIHRADVSALAHDHRDMSRAALLRTRIEELETAHPSREIGSPVSGRQLMQELGLEPGPLIGEVKEWLTNEVIEGRLSPIDGERALALAQERFGAGR